MSLETRLHCPGKINFSWKGNNYLRRLCVYAIFPLENQNAFICKLTSGARQGFEVDEQHPYIFPIEMRPHRSVGRNFSLQVGSWCTHTALVLWTMGTKEILFPLWRLNIWKKLAADRITGEKAHKFINMHKHRNLTKYQTQKRVRWLSLSNTQLHREPEAWGCWGSEDS